MKTRTTLLLFLLVTVFMSPEVLIAQFNKQLSQQNQRSDKAPQSITPYFPPNDPDWKKNPPGQLPRQNQHSQRRSNKPITKTFLGCTFRVTTMEDAVRLFSNNNFKGEVGEKDILLYGVKFADRIFPYTQFVFNNDKLCVVNFISVYTDQKKALNRRADLKQALSKKYNLIEDKRDGYKCYFAGDDNDRIVALTVQAVDDSKSETGKVYWVYLQYVDTKQARAINDDL